MKKLFMMCFVALSAFALVSCDSDDNTEVPADEYDYTLTITPSTAAIGTTITMTIVGDNVGDFMWTSCFNRIDDGTGNCIVPGFVNGVATYEVSSDLMSAGTYKFYAETQGSDESYKTNYFEVTITE